ncbi:MAG: DMT family transporter, partial [Pyrinomonadaceae bacterium]|nr:DMT family transporter [Pyrinomonadaceae bacterium]
LIFGVIFGIEKLRLIKVFGIVLAACGVIILIDPRKASFSSETTLGDILVILNSLCYGIYVVISKDMFIRNGAIKSTAWIFTFASLLCVPLGIYSLSTIEISTVNVMTWAAILHIAIISTTMPYLLISWTLARVNPSTVAVYVYMQPLIGFCMAVIFLNESFTISTIISAILIFTGVYFASKKRQNVIEKLK